MEVDRSADTVDLVSVSSFASPRFAVPGFTTAVRLAVENGLEAVAILNAEGEALAMTGAFDADQARAISAVATWRVTSPGMIDRMLRGELVTSVLGGREASIGIAAGSVFFVVVFGQDLAATSLVAVDELRADIEHMLGEASALLAGTSVGAPPSSSSGGSSSGPAELPVIEIGVTVRQNN